MKKIACCIFKIKVILLTAVTIVSVQYRVVAQELTVLNKMKWFAEAPPTKDGTQNQKNGGVCKPCSYSCTWLFK